MKTLEDQITGRRDFPIFKGTGTQIKNWVSDNLDCLGLNESFSCSVYLYGDTLEVSGDEDLMTLKIINIEIVEL